MTSARQISMKKTFQDFFALADIQINGERPWDMQVHDPRLYARVFAGGSLGLGEAYVDGWWDCKALDLLSEKVLRARLDTQGLGLKKMMWHTLKANLLNLQSKSRAYHVGKRHYDIGNDLYKRMLDKRMVYSCAYWKNANTLDEAQEAKLHLISEKIGLQPGMNVLDIGCGWGSFAKYATENYKVNVLGITISKEQAALARETCEGLPVEIRLQDYRDVKEQFDHIVSIGMFEHVGYKNYRTYMMVVNRCLNPDGLFLLQTIGQHTSKTSNDPWIHKYIFPNSMAPSAKQITNAIEGLFMIEDWHVFGTDYSNTIMAWYRNFTKNWDVLKEAYDERFYRMWTYYLLLSAGVARSQTATVWQIVFSKEGVKGGYQSIR